MGYLAAKIGLDQPSAADREQAIDEIKRALLARVSPRTIYVFGSILTEDFGRASDIDVAVIFATPTQLAEGKARIFSTPIVSTPFDVLLYVQQDFERKAEEGGICQVIKDTGRCIYDAGTKI